MPWQPKDLMQTKLEFVTLALKEGANRRELCRRFSISPKTGYALLNRFAADGAAGLQPRRRKPLRRAAPTDSILPVTPAKRPQRRRPAPRRRLKAWAAS